LGVLHLQELARVTVIRWMALLYVPKLFLNNQLRGNVKNKITLICA